VPFTGQSEQRPAAIRRRHAGAAHAASPWRPRGRLLARLRRTPFLLAAELPAPAGGTVGRAVHDAATLRGAGCDAVLIGPPRSVRAQVSPIGIAVLVQQRVEGLDVILGVASWERSLIALQADLLGAAAFGVGAVLCLAGSPPRPDGDLTLGGIWDVNALRLVQLLRGLNDGRDLHGIPLARPTSFVIGCQVCPGAEERAREIGEARQAIAAGVDFLIAQPVFDLDALDQVLDAVGVPDELPVLLGTVVLRGFAHAEELQHEVPGMAIPEPVLERLWLAREDGPCVGRQIARELIAGARARGRVRGVVLSAAADATASIGCVLRDRPAVAPRG